MGFKDHFSGHAQAYAAFRPKYPKELYEWLGDQAPQRSLAWDAGTGSGQAAVALAEHFERVIATDASAKQLAQATAHPKVEYRAEPSEATSLGSHSVELISVAQALHWFDLPRFWAEVRRVGRPGAVLAVWCYDLLTSGLERVDAELLHFYRHEVGAFWPPDRKAVEDGYRSLLVPFEELAVPAFSMRADWNLDQLCGYLGTWSAVAQFRLKNQQDPLPPLRERLVPRWGDPASTRALAWPLAVRAFRVDEGR